MWKMLPFTVNDWSGSMRKSRSPRGVPPGSVRPGYLPGSTAHRSSPPGSACRGTITLKEGRGFTDM